MMLESGKRSPDRTGQPLPGPDASASDIPISAPNRLHATKPVQPVTVLVVASLAVLLFGFTAWIWHAYHLLDRARALRGTIPQPIGTLVPTEREPRRPAIYAPGSEREYQRMLTEARDKAEHGALQEAIKVYESAARMRPIDPSPRVEIARILLDGRIKDWQGAIAQATRALELDPDDVAAYETRSRARRLAGDTTGALQDFERAKTAARRRQRPRTQIGLDAAKPDPRDRPGGDFTSTTAWSGHNRP